MTGRVSHNGGKALFLPDPFFLPLPLRERAGVRGDGA